MGNGKKYTQAMILLSGKPSLSAILREAGVDRSHLSKEARGNYKTISDKARGPLLNILGITYRQYRFLIDSKWSVKSIRKVLSERQPTTGEQAS